MLMRAVSAAGSSAYASRTQEAEFSEPGGPRAAPLQVTVVMKFGGSSVRDAERMREVANIVCSFPDQLPAVVLSAMGKTTNNLLQSGDSQDRSRIWANSVSA